jgi:hypothetical protein
MPAPLLQPVRVAPERLTKAEQLATELYKLAAQKTTGPDRIRRDVEELALPLTLRQHKLRPGYKSRMAYLRQFESTIDDAGQFAPREAFTPSTFGVLTALDQIVIGKGDHHAKLRWKQWARAYASCSPSNFHNAIAGGEISENHGVTPRPHTRTSEAMAHVSIKAAPQLKEPPLHTTETSPTPQQTATSTAEQIGQASDSPSTCLIKTSNGGISHLTDHRHSHLHLLTSTPEEPKMSTTSSQEDFAVTDSMISPNHGRDSPTFGWDIASKIEANLGRRRAASDGKIIEEVTGALVDLDISDDEAQQYYTETNKYAPHRRYAVPEVKNGSTALDDSRTRKPVARVLKNWLTGSSRPPPEKPFWVFETANNAKPGKIMLSSMIETRRYQGGADVRHTMIKVMKRFWDYELIVGFGREWALKADDKDEVMVTMEDYVMDLVDPKPKQRDEDDSEGEEVVVAAPKAPKKRGWFW